MVLFFSNKSIFTMNMLIKLDNYLLGVTKSGARVIYLLIGIDNFKLAHICVFVGIAIRLFVIYMRSVPKNELAIGLGFLIIFMSLLNLFFEERHTHPDILNPSRITRRPSRVIWLWTSFILLFITFDGKQNIKDIMSYLSMIFMFVMPLYLFSIEPEPPSESKLKKLMSSIRSIFSSNPLPQPA